VLNKTVVKFSVERVVISERCAGMDAYDKVISYPIMVLRMVMSWKLDDQQVGYFIVMIDL